MLSFLKRNSEETVPVTQIDSLIGKINLIDIRETHEYAGGHIKTAKNIPMGELLKRPDQYMDKNKKYYLMCQSGMRSGRTVSTLKKAGYQVVDVTGGMGAYNGHYKEK